MFSPVPQFDLQTLPAAKWSNLDRLSYGSGGHYGTYTNFQDDANSGALGPHLNSNRDDHSFSDSNTYSTREISIDLTNFIPGDINQHELIFSINVTPRVALYGKGQLAPSEHIMGLSKLNEWLRTSDKGIELGKYKNSRVLRDIIAFRGVIITSMEQVRLQQGHTKSVTIAFNGRTTIPDITAWSRSSKAYKYRNTTQTFDYLSICFRRVVPKNPLNYDVGDIREFAPYWQAIPEKHFTSTPPKYCYTSMDSMGVEDEHQFQGYFIQIGCVRAVMNGNYIGVHGVAQKAYNYLFKKNGKGQSHISDYNSLPYLEIFLTSTVQHG